MYRVSKPLFGVYVHWPYCLSKCPYCDFFSQAERAINEEEILKGYQRDILFFARLKKSYLPITSLFFGGGTPSLMSPQSVEKVLTTLQDWFAFDEMPEITMEANPDAINLEKMQAFRAAGVNRLSMGIQALNEADLRFLGRRHTVETALMRLEEAKQIFPKVNADFIYARPHQTPDAWKTELTQILNLNLTHYSLYQLTIEENTPFYRKQVTVPDEETARTFYLMTNKMMEKASLPPYEISNYAQEGFQCVHNLTYWRGYDYLGIGPAAHGRLGLTATENPRSVTAWIKQKPMCTQLTRQEKTEEKILMGLRLMQEGFPVSLLNSKGIETAVRFGWGQVKNGLFFPSEEGTLVLNRLILTVLPEERM